MTLANCISLTARQLMGSGRVLIVTRIVGTGLGFAATVVLSRLLGAQGYGQYALALMVVSLLAVPLGSGWSTLILRTISQKVDGQRWRDTAALVHRGRQLSAAYALTILVFGWVLFQVTAADIVGWTVVCISALLFIRQNSAFRLALIRGIGYPTAAQLPELIVQPLVLTGILFLMSFVRAEGVSWNDAIYALVVASFSTLLCGAVLQRWLIEPPREKFVPANASRMGKWLPAAGIIGLNGVLMTLFLQVDTYILATLTDTASVGVYRIAVQCATLGGFAYSALNYLAAARMNAAWSEGRLQDVEEISGRFGKISLLFVGGVFVLTVLIGAPAIDFVFGDEFEGAVTMILILLLGQAINAAVGMPAVLLTMTGHERQIIRRTIIALAINAIVAWLLVPLFGVYGAACANVCGVIYVNAAYYWVVRKRLGVNLAVWRVVF